MQKRNFITNTVINTSRLVAVYDDQMGMVGYTNDRPFGDAFVFIKEHGYFVRIGFFNMDYEDYVNAALYLELPVITNFTYNEYVEKLNYERAVYGALSGAITETILAQLIEGLARMDETFPGPTLPSFENYDEVVNNINCLKRLIVQHGSKPFDVGTAFEKDPEDYSRPLHHALKVIVEENTRRVRGSRHC
jgi:hypothetical protein